MSLRRVAGSSTEFTAGLYLHTDVSNLLSPGAQLLGPLPLIPVKASFRGANKTWLLEACYKPAWGYGFGSFWGTSLKGVGCLAEHMGAAGKLTMSATILSVE